jgi:TolB-like protein
MTDEKGVGIKGWLSGPGRKILTDQPGVEKHVPLDKHRIAVLPMTNISPDQRDEYFAEGVTDELIAAISKIPGLHVIARTSSEKYKGSGKGISEISKELRIGTILEGTVRTVGNQLRVTAQLIDSQTEESLWSERYDRKLGDVFDIQSDIARNVAEGLKIQLHSGHQQSQKKPTENSEAYAHYLKGRHFSNRGMFEYKKILSEFELAIEKDPAFALGHSGLAETYLMMSRYGYVSPRLGYPKGADYSEKAISLDESLAEPQAVLAMIRQEYEWKWAEAQTGFKRAIELNPSYSTAHAWYALYLGHVGQCDLGLNEAKRAVELDPLGRWGHQSLSEEYLFAHQYDKAIEATETMMELFPESGIPYYSRAVAEVEKGMYDEAVADFQKPVKQSDPPVPGGTGKGRLGHAYAISGRTADANTILHELESQPVPASPVSPFPPRSRAIEIGLVYLGLGKNQLALEWLDKAADERTSQIIHLKCEPIFSSLRGETAYKALLHKIGLDRANLGK